MSFNPSQQQIDPFKLLSEALAQVAPVYIPLLIISSPGILVQILQEIVPQPLKAIVATVYMVALVPIIAGVGMYFCYRYLKQGTIDLGGAIEKAMGQSVQLILGSIIYSVATLLGLICLVIPGIYISVRFAFVLYAIISENCSAIEGFKYSSKLVEGRWWAVFGSMLVILLFFIPITLLVAMLSAIFIKQPLIISMISVVLSTLLTPPAILYYNKLYIRLQELVNLQPKFE